MKINDKEIFMKPGKTNQEDRENYVRFWVECMKSMSDQEWSKQQNIIINSQLRGANHEIYLKVKGLKRKLDESKRC